MIMTQEAQKTSLVIWQSAGEDLAAPALLLNQFSDCIEIHQEGAAITVNYETMPELIKAFRKMTNDRAAI